LPLPLFTFHWQGLPWLLLATREARKCGLIKRLGSDLQHYILWKKWRRDWVHGIAQQYAGAISVYEVMKACEKTRTQKEIV
jgi:hypothetical protein